VARCIDQIAIKIGSMSSQTSNIMLKIAKKTKLRPSVEIISMEYLELSTLTVTMQSLSEIIQKFSILLLLEMSYKP